MGCAALMPSICASSRVLQGERSRCWSSSQPLVPPQAAWLGINIFLFTYYFLFFDRDERYFYTRAILGVRCSWQHPACPGVLLAGLEHPRAVPCPVLFQFTTAPSQSLPWSLFPSQHHSIPIPIPQPQPRSLGPLSALLGPIPSWGAQPAGSFTLSLAQRYSPHPCLHLPSLPWRGPGHRPSASTSTAC